MEKVLVLMSTYNGEKFLIEQIESILTQKNVLVDILVRDDGSSDNTLGILEEYKKRGCLNFYTGENLRPANSFMDLIYNAPDDVKYYAFSDQDDVWKDTKLYSAVKKINGIRKPTLYYHAMDIVDEKLQKYDYYFREEYFAKSLKYSALFGDEIAGCTMVFNRELLDVIRYYHPQYISMHDGWIHRVCLSVGGIVIGDEIPYIQYRQHGNNVVGMKKRTVWNQLRKLKKKERRFSKLATEMLNGYSEIMDSEDREFLEQLSKYTKVKDKIYIIKTAKKTCKEKNVIRNLSVKLWCNSF